MLNKFGTDAKNSILGAIQGADDIVTNLREAITRHVEAAVRDASTIAVSPLEAAAQVVQGAIAANHEIDSDNTTAIVRSAIETLAKAGTDTIEAISRAVVRGAVHGAHDAGGDISKTAATAVVSSIEAAARRGADPSAAARQAATGALKAATEIGGQPTRNKVAAALRDASSVPRDALDAALRNVK